MRNPIVEVKPHLLHLIILECGRSALAEWNEEEQRYESDQMWWDDLTLGWRCKHCNSPMAIVLDLTNRQN